MQVEAQMLEQQLGIVMKERTDALFTIPAADLLDREQLAAFLEIYRQQIKGRDLQVAASYFASSWRVVCAALHYALAVAPGKFRFSLDQLTVQMVMVNQFPWVYYVMNAESGEPWPLQEHQGAEELELTGFYSEVLRPVLDQLAAVSGLPVTQLWGQLPLGVRYYVHALSERLESAEQRARLLAKYELGKQLPGASFGLKRNPYLIKEIKLDDPYRPGEKTTMKPTCCLAYRTEGDHGYCYGCPKLTKSERETKRQSIVERLAAAKAT